MARKAKAKGPGIEERLLELEALVKDLEDGTLPLEESLDLFEKGIKLSRELQESLRKAEMRVTRLLEGEDAQEAPYHGPEKPDEGDES
jgi:exodeoxyribonuclease VII small subunit